MRWQLQQLKHACGADVRQAAGMAQGAVARKARRTVQRRLVRWVGFQPQHFGLAVQWGGVQRAA